MPVTASVGYSQEGNLSPRRQLTPMENAFSGAMAGVVCRVVIAPFDVVKIRFQVS